MEDNSILGRWDRWSLAGAKACSGADVMIAVVIGRDVRRIKSHCCWLANIVVRRDYVLKHHLETPLRLRFLTPC